MSTFGKPKSGLKKPPSRKMLAIILTLPTIFIILISTCVLVIILDAKIPYLNPSDKTYTIAMPFWYPNIPAGGGINFDNEIFGSIYCVYLASSRPRCS